MTKIKQDKSRAKLKLSKETIRHLNVKTDIRAAGTPNMSVEVICGTTGGTKIC
jgi:hypothetical protein